MNEEKLIDSASAEKPALSSTKSSGDIFVQDANKSFGGN